MALCSLTLNALILFEIYPRLQMLLHCIVPLAYPRVINTAWIRDFSNKISPLLHKTSFPMSDESIHLFSEIKEEICSAALAAFDKCCLPVEVETDASATSIAGCVSQKGRPVAFFWPSVE